MSYDIAICVGPIPPSDQQAWRELDALIDEKGTAAPVFHELVTQLTARFPDDDDHADDSIWSLLPIRHCVGHRATVLNMRHRNAHEAVPAIVETAKNMGLVVFDWQTAQILRPDGIKGLLLTVESKPVLKDPTLEQIAEAVDQLTTETPPTFVILEGRGEDYTQAASRGIGYVAEWRLHLGGKVKHLAARVREAKAQVDAQSLMTESGNEYVSNSDVKQIMGAYARGENPPDQFAWQDMTAVFN